MENLQRGRTPSLPPSSRRNLLLLTNFLPPPVSRILGVSLRFRLSALTVQPFPRSRLRPIMPVVSRVLRTPRRPAPSRVSRVAPSSLLRLSPAPSPSDPLVFFPPEVSNKILRMALEPGQDHLCWTWVHWRDRKAQLRIFRRVSQGWRTHSYPLMFEELYLKDRRDLTSFLGHTASDVAVGGHVRKVVL